MKKNLFNYLLGGAILISAPMFTSCDDILGTWDKPVPVTPTGGGSSSSEGVEYIAYTVSGTTATPSTQTAATYTEVTSSTTTWAAGTYVVSSDVTIDGDVTLSGDVELILCDGKTLTVNGQIASTNSLTIYGQSGGTGELKVVTTASEYSVNCKNIYFHGGTLTASNSEATVGQVLFVTDELSIIAGTVKATSTAGVPVMIDQGTLSVYDATLDASTAATGANVISNWGTGTFTIYSNTAVIKACGTGGCQAIGLAITNGAAAALSYDTSSDGTTWVDTAGIPVSGTASPTEAYVRFPAE